MSYRNYRQLKVWQKGVSLVKTCYGICDHLPDREKYGLASQIRRCCISIPANIAEGQGRGSAAEIRQFSRIALGSLSELDTHLYIAEDLYGIDVSPAYDLIEELARMLPALISMVKDESATYGDSPDSAVCSAQSAV